MTMNLDKSAWQRVALGDVAEASKEKVDATDGSVTRYVAGEHMDTDDLKIHRWGEVGDGYLGPAFHRRFRPGQVLYGSRRTYLRKVAVADFDGVCANTTFVLQSRDPDRLLPEFLPWIMTSEPFHSFAIAESKGSVNPYVNWSDVARYPLNLPTLDEQKRIADVLWAAERHRRALKRREASVRQVAVRQTDAAMASFDEQVLATGADAFTEVTVGIVVRPAQYYTDSPDGIPALRGLNVLPGSFELTDLVRFRPDAAASLSKSTLREGDVVIVRSGRPGDAAVVTEEVAGANCIDLIIARPSERLDPNFFVRVLNSEFGRFQVGRRSAGTAQQHFNVGALKKMMIPLPDLATQRALVNDLSQMQDAADAARTATVATETLTKSLVRSVFEAAT